MSLGSEKTRNWCLLVLVQFITAAQYPAFAVASESFNVASLSFWMFAIATLILGPFLLLNRRASVNHVRGPEEKDRFGGWHHFVILGSLGLIPASVVLTWGIERSSASNASILSLTVPVIMVALGVLMLGERPVRFYWVTLLATMLGTIVLSWSDVSSGRFNSATLWGNILILFASVGAAFYNTYSKRLMKSFSELELVIKTYAVCLVICSALSLMMDTRPFYDISQVSLRSWIGVLVLSAGSWGLIMILWLWLIKRLYVGQLATSIYLIPVFGVALSAVTLGEMPTLVQILGGLIVVVAAYLSMDTSATIVSTDSES